MRVVTFDLLRHGETRAAGIYQGSSDVALSVRGREQMLSAFGAGNAQGWQVVYSSPLLRCSEPARQESAKLGLPSVLMPWLSEYHFGAWDGRSFADVHAEYPVQVEQFWADPESCPPPGGEPISLFQQRVLAGVHALLETEYTHCLLVTHGGVIRALIAHCLQMPYTAWSKIKLDHAHFTRIQFYLNKDGQAPWGQVVHCNVACLPVLIGPSELDAAL